MVSCWSRSLRAHRTTRRSGSSSRRSPAPSARAGTCALRPRSRSTMPRSPNRTWPSSGALRDYATAHPVDPVLVVEVSLSSLAFDREHKASLYARAGRPEYWIVNLIDRVLEIGREPGVDLSAPYGWDYARVDVLGPAERVTALGAPGVEILVADLLP